MLVDVEGGNAEVAHDVALHVAAMAPSYVDVDDVPADVLEKEKRFLISQAQDSGKPAEIIEKMVDFRVKSLSPDTTGDQLLAFQSDIQELQVRLLKIKLSCRDLVMTTFTDDQWENFAFVVADNPRLASLMQEVNK